MGPVPKRRVAWNCTLDNLVNNGLSQIIEIQIQGGASHVPNDRVLVEINVFAIVIIYSLPR